VPLPHPELGLVVYYSYVFRNPTRNIGAAGKQRPCLIIAVFPDRAEPRRTSVLYLPITHSQPTQNEEAIEIPADTRFAAGLDGLPQWVLIGGGDLDTWPEDIFNLPNQPGVFHFGFMPPGFFRKIQTEFGRLFAEKKYNVLRR
jgi:hypothetical protein